MINEAELKILEMIQAGEITAEEGFRLIDAMRLGAEFVPLINWFLKNFASYISGLQDQPYKEWIDILKNLSQEDPFYVQSNDGGNQVEVFIG